jgi:lipopolysaccharide biosynthesis regulator YciM
MVVLQADRGDKTPPSPSEVAWGLTRTALRVRSQSKRLRLLNLALAKDPDCSVARIELADMEFQSANWKACREAYEEIIHR